MKKVFVTRKLLKENEQKLQELFEVKLNTNDKIYSAEEIIEGSKDCDGILSSVTDPINSDTISKLSNSIKIIANGAVGYGNIDCKAAKEKGEKLVRSVGYKIDDVPFIPVSGWKGDNLVKKSENMSWYSGKTLLESFDDLTVEEKPTGKPLRLPIQDVYSITGVGTVPVGRVETGLMKPGQKIVVMPSGAQGEIKSIESHHAELPSAEAGDNIGFNLRGIEKKDIKRGDVLGTPDAPPNVAKEFKAQIIVIHHPTAIAPGYTPVMHAHTAQVAATITEFLGKINPQTGAMDEENPKFLKVGDSAIVKIRPVRPTPIETFSEFPEMGRFALRDMGATIAAGVVKEITEAHTP